MGTMLKAKNSNPNRYLPQKPDTKPIDPWLHDINRRDMDVEIVCFRGGGFQLAVNFDQQAIALLREVKNLLCQVACYYKYGEGCEEGLSACC